MQNRSSSNKKTNKATTDVYTLGAMDAMHSFWQWSLYGGDEMSARRVILLFSHQLTEPQRMELRNEWDVYQQVSLPVHLQKLWSDVPPDLPTLKDYLQPLVSWLETVTREEDLVLIQGEFGATYLVVSEALRLGLVPVYSTTAREVSEQLGAAGEVLQTRVFRHQRFRIYGQ